MALILTGFLCSQSWWGLTRTEVEIIGRTTTRYRIRAIEKTRMAGACRWLGPGESALVPLHAVRDHCEECCGTKGGVPGNENIISGRVLCDFCSEKDNG